MRFLLNDIFYVLCLVHMHIKAATFSFKTFIESNLGRKFSEIFFVRLKRIQQALLRVAEDLVSSVMALYSEYFAIVRYT